MTLDNQASRLQMIGFNTSMNLFGGSIKIWGGEIAQSLVSLSTKRAIRVHAQLNPHVTERWNSITVLLTRSHQCRRLVKKTHPCVIMSV